MEELSWQVLEDLDRELSDIVPGAKNLLFDLAMLGGATSPSKLRKVILKKVGSDSLVEPVLDILIWAGCIGVHTDAGTVYISDCGFKRPYIRSLMQNDEAISIVFHPTLASIFATPTAPPARSAASRRHASDSQMSGRET